MSRTPNVDFVFPYLLLNLLWQYFHGVQGEILSRSHCCAHPLFSSVVQLASCVTGISHNSVRLFIYLRAPCHSGVTLMESRLWVEVLARRRAVPCVIPALWRGSHSCHRPAGWAVTPPASACCSAWLSGVVCASSVFKSFWTADTAGLDSSSCDQTLRVFNPMFCSDFHFVVKPFPTYIA